MALPVENRRPRARAVLLTAVAMVAFAANSLLCRKALGQELIDAASFTTIRIIAGVAWGAYCVVGQSSGGPLLATAANFVYCVPLTLVLSALFMQSADASVPGVLLAIASGAFASGLGYAVWYSVLPDLTTGQAATVQLSVPVIAALGGVLLLSEEATMRLVIASCLTLGGIWLVLVQKSRHTRGQSQH